jgi:hypothetical protein
MSRDDSYVGWWGVRPGGKWHLIESEVAGDVVMRCGRRMAQASPYGALSFMLEPDPEWPRCSHCAGGQARD